MAPQGGSFLASGETSDTTVSAEDAAARYESGRAAQQATIDFLNDRLDGNGLSYFLQVGTIYFGSGEL